jgi:hypothetical protein
VSEFYAFDGAFDDESAFHDSEFPLAPEAVLHAYRSFWRATRQPHGRTSRILRAMTEANTLIADFCDEYLAPQVYSAAMLSGLYDAMSEPATSLSAKKGLRTYLMRSNETAEDKLFVLGLLSDRRSIDEFWANQLTSMYEDDPDRLTLLTDPTNTLQVPERAWEQPVIGTKAEAILRLRSEKGVNIESLLVEAAQTLQWLHTDQAKNDTATLQKMHIAESLYAPLAEVIGFDGIAMALQSRCVVLRNAHTGKQDSVDQAERIIANLGDPSIVEARTQTMLEAVLGENIHEQVLTHATPHGIVIGEGICTKDDLRVVWRRKTIGSLARKLSKLEADQTPMDIIGATIITQTTTQAGSVISDLLKRVQYDPRVVLRPSPSRTSPLHIKGGAQYVQEIATALGYSSIEDLKNVADVVVTNNSSYQVAKVTLTFQRWGEPWPLHAELQFTTEADRIEARIGSAAHALYKLSGGVTNTAHTDNETHALAELRAQKRHLGQNGLTALSRERAHKLERSMLE